MLLIRQLIIGELKQIFKLFYQERKLYNFILFYFETYLGNLFLSSFL